MLLRPQLRLLGRRNGCSTRFVIRGTRTRLFSLTRNIYGASDFKPPRSTGKEGRKSISVAAEPYWKALTSQIQEYKSLFARIRRQIFIHAKEAQDSIREANQKLANQESDRTDQRFNYDKDVENSSRIEDLPSQREVHRRQWSRKLEFYLDSLQETVLTATKALNDVTGYSSIQKLRKSIDIMEKNLEQDRGYLKSLKEKYASAIEQRTESQRELNELLQRKSSWSPTDLDRFTQLYRNDAMNLKREQELKEEVKAKESKQEELISDLYHAILTRYHEEQIWSDKIRRTSTWGTFILMGVNIVLFLVFQLLLEPWKRRRLTSSFEDKVKSALDKFSVEQSQKFEEFSNNLGDSSKLKPQEVVKESYLSQESPQRSREITPLLSDVKNGFSLKTLSWTTLYYWLKDYAKKFRPIILLWPNSAVELSSGEFYFYSGILLAVGALSGSLL